MRRFFIFRYAAWVFGAGRSPFSVRRLVVVMVSLSAMMATSIPAIAAGASTAAPSRIYVGQIFSIGETVSSASGVYSATMLSKGEVQIKKDGRVVWKSGASLRSSHVFSSAASGGLKIVASKVFSHRQAHAKKITPSYLTVLNNGDLALIAKSGIPIWQVGRQAHLATSSSIYTPGELYGSSNPSAVCFTCEAVNVTGSAPPSNTLDSGTQVDNLTGDFNTSLDLFKAPAIGGSLSLSLSYDAQLAQSELISGSALPLFGYGWSSNLTTSITSSQTGSTPNSTETVNQGNGSEVTFSQSAVGGTSTACETAGSSPSGDYPSTAKYTVVGSSNQWCALSSVQGQLGEVSSTGLTYETNGGQSIEDFAWNGQLAEITTQADSSSPPVQGISLLYHVTGGSPVTTTTGVALSQQCPVGATCDIAYSSDGRSIVEALNSSGLVTTVINPAGAQYSLHYDTDNNLLSVVEPVTTSSTSTWNYVYSESSGYPFTSNLVEIYDPDATVATPAPLVAGASHSTTITYYGSNSPTENMVESVADGVLVLGEPSTTTYSYSQECAPIPSQQTDPCLNQGVTQVTTVTYPAETPCPTGSCTSPSPQYPVEIDQYSAGIETSSQLGSTSNSTENETWLFNWNFGNGTANTSEVITYPNTLQSAVPPSSQAPTATIISDPAGNIISTTNALGDVATSAYNDVGGNNLPELLWSFPGPASSSSTSAPPGSWTYSYNAYGQVETATDPLGNTTTYGYYQNDSLLCYVSPPSVGGNPELACASSSPLSDQGAVGAPAGSTTYSYDAQGDVVATTVDSNDPAPGADPQTTTALYDPLGNELWSIPSSGQAFAQGPTNPYATSAVYSLASVPLTVTGPNEVTTSTPLNKVTNYTYDAALNVTATATATPAVTTTTTVYDGDNRACYSVVSSSIVAGLSCTSVLQAGATATSYVPGSLATATVTDANGNTTSYYYGDLAYPTSPTEVVDPIGNEITYNAYDDLGNLCLTGDQPDSAQFSATQCSVTAGDTATTYNALGSSVTVINPNGSGDDEITNYYDDPAYPTNVTRSVNKLNEVTDYTYDADGRLLTTVNPEQTTTSSPVSSAETVSYNANGEICSRVPTSNIYPCGEGPAVPGVSEYTYNDAGDLISMNDNVGSPATPSQWDQTTTYLYSNGQLVSSTDPNGATLSYLYNFAGQVSCEAYPVSSGSSCGSASAPTTPSATNTIVTRSYDSLGRLNSTTDWLGNTTSYSYGDPNDPSAVTNINYPTTTNMEATYSYDHAGNLTCLSVGSASSGSTCAQSGSLLNDAWTYNRDEQLLTSSIDGSMSQPVTYTGDKQVTSATNPGTATNNDTYQLASNGDIASDGSPNGQFNNFTYNQGDELCNEVTGASSSSSTAACVGTLGNGQSGSNFTYNLNGERTSSTAYVSGTAGATTNYSWNSQGELCGVGPANLACGMTPTSGTSYGYNGIGLRTEILTSTSSTHSTWDTVSGGSLPLDINDATTTAGSTTNTSYLYGNLLFGGTAPVEQITSNTSGSTAVFLISIPSGVQGVMSSTGSLLESAVYSPYGTQYLESNTADVTPFGFQGAYADATGLIYLVNRYYDPSTDQFLSVDPDVQETDQPYAFVNDDPLNATDPLGTMFVLVQGETDQNSTTLGAKVDAILAKNNQAYVKQTEIQEAKKAVSAYVKAESSYNACIAQAKGIARDTIPAGAIGAVAIPGLHAALELMKRIGKSPAEVAGEDPEIGVPVVIIIGPAVIVGAGLAALIRAALC